MKRDLLSRYDRAPDGAVLIDVSAARAEDLYSDFDRSAPYIRRDLNQELVDYLGDCAREVGGEPFTIRFLLGQLPDDAGLSRIRRSVSGFFGYLEELEWRDVRRMFRRSPGPASIGLGTLFISVWVNRGLDAGSSVVRSVFAEGLTIAAWVSLWEALATFLIEWFPHRANIILYRRLAGARVVFQSVPAAGRPGGGAPLPAGRC